MDSTIAILLMQDGITTGAIHALLALALVLVFSATRIIFIPQGEFVAFGALTLVAIQSGRVPATMTLLLVLGAVAVFIAAPNRNRAAPSSAPWSASSTFSSQTAIRFEIRPPGNT